MIVRRCLVLFALLDKHNQHKCSDINKSGEKFKEQMKDDVKAVTSCELQEQEEDGTT